MTSVSKRKLALLKVRWKARSRSRRFKEWCEREVERHSVYCYWTKNGETRLVPITEAFGLVCKAPDA